VETSGLIRTLLHSIVYSQPLEERGEVARGGTGSIRRAQEHPLGRQVALKQLLESCEAEPVLVRNFLREAQVTAQLDHPHIVPVHQVGLRDGKPFFTMSLVEGQSLSRWLRTAILIDYDTVVDFAEILIKVSDALAYAHSRSVIHCDLKPANIMIGAFGQVYLMDWGGAEVLEAPPENGGAPVAVTVAPLPTQMTEGRLFGTPSYIAPERARGERGDVRSDVFSLGAIMYEFVEGKPPFRGADTRETLIQAGRCDCRPPNEGAHGSHVPPDYYRILRRAMAARPAERYQTMLEMRADLGRLVRGGGSLPRRTYQRGTTVIQEGEVGDAAYVVASGQLEVTRQEHGIEVVLRTLGPGDVFGEMSLLTNARRTASVVALQDSTLVTITEDLFRRELEAMQPWMASLVRTLARLFLEQERS